MTTGQIPWTTWPFQATGAPTPRTQPNRLAEVKDVKDFGAMGDGITDDWQAIQNAVNWTTGPGRGTIFFPPGIYLVNQPITFNYDPAPGQPGLSICFQGVSGQASRLQANFSGAGFVLDRHLATPNNTASVVIERLTIIGGGSLANYGGAVRVGSCSNVVVRDCPILSGFTCFTSEDSPGNSSQSISLENSAFHGGLNGIVMGGSGWVTGCDWIGCDNAARMYGNGWVMGGNRIERCNTAYLIGRDTTTMATFTGTVACATFTGTFSGTSLTVSNVQGTIQAGQTIFVPGGAQCQIVSGSGSSWVTNVSQTIGPVACYTNGVLNASSVTGTIEVGQQLLDLLGNVPQAISIISQVSGTVGGAGVYGLTNPGFTVSVSQAMQTMGKDVGASGFSIESGTTEGDWINLDFVGTCSGFYIGPLAMTGHNSGNAGAPLAPISVNSYTYNSGTGAVTLNLSNNATFAAGSIFNVFSLNIAGLNGHWFASTVSGATVTFTGPTGLGGSPSPGGTCGVQATQYYVLIRANKCSNGTFLGASGGGDFADVAGASVGTSTSRANLVFTNLTLSANAPNTNTGVDWVLPTNAYTAVWQGCNIQPIWTFSQLPAVGGGNDQEGDEFNISDSTVTGWGNNVTVGGGSNAVAVRNNGTHYTVFAI